MEDISIEIQQTLSENVKISVCLRSVVITEDRINTFVLLISMALPRFFFVHQDCQFSLEFPACACFSLSEG